MKKSEILKVQHVLRKLERGGEEAQPPPERDRFARPCTGEGPVSFGPCAVRRPPSGVTRPGAAGRETRNHLKKRSLRIRRI